MHRAAQKKRQKRKLCGDDFEDPRPIPNQTSPRNDGESPSAAARDSVAIPEALQPHEAESLPAIEIFINHNMGVLARLYRDTMWHFLSHYK